METWEGSEQEIAELLAYQDPRLIRVTVRSVQELKDIISAHGGMVKGAFRPCQMYDLEDYPEHICITPCNDGTAISAFAQSYEDRVAISDAIF